MSAISQNRGSIVKPKRAALAYVSLLCCLLMTIAMWANGLLRRSAMPQAPMGVIVEAVAPGSPAQKAGLHVGDVLLSYAARPISSPFAFLAAEENCRGALPVTLEARRERQILKVLLPAGISGLTVRPALPSRVLSLYRAGQAQANLGNWKAAIAQWRSAAMAAQAVKDKMVLGWLDGVIAKGYMQLATGMDRIPNVIEAQTWLQDAWKNIKRTEDRAAQVNISIALGERCLNLGNIEAAFPWFEQAFSIAIPDGNTLWAALARDLQGLILLNRYARPMSTHFRIDIAMQKDLAKARGYCNQALEIYERALPGSKQVAESLRHRAYIAGAQGELEDAQHDYEQALALRQTFPPKSSDIMELLHELGDLATLRGNAIDAQRYYREALTCLPPDNFGISFIKAILLRSMGVVFTMQGDLDHAKQYLYQSLALSQKVNALDLTEMAPRRAEKTLCLITLGLIVATQHDASKAQNLCQQALTLERQSGCLSQEGQAVTLNTLGWIATSSNQPVKARQYYAEAQDIWRKIAPDSAGMAVSLNGLGTVAVSRGDLAGAQTLLQQARDILRVKASGAFGEANVLANLGRLYYLQHQPEKALPLLEEAVTDLDTHRQRILDLESRSLFMQLYSSSYLDLIQTYLTLGHPDKAFATLERLHARSFTDSLAEWRFQLNQNLPSTLRFQQQKLDNLRRISEKDLQRAREKSDPATVEAAQNALEALAGQQRLLDADIRQDYIRELGHAIEYPQPIDLKGAQQTLPDGTLALAYAVDRDNTYLFAITNISFHSYVLPFSQKQLTERVGQVRDLLTDIHSRPRMYAGILQALYRDLLKPAQEQITLAKTLLFCPDGPLNQLPFAALMPAQDRFLIQEKPLISVASLTIYQNLRSNPRPPITSLLALGDPDNDRVAGPKRSREERLVTEKTTWERLPETGKLAEEIGKQYAPQSTVLLRKRATVANLEAGIGEASLVHLGCHGMADNQIPFGSWLALTPTSKDDTGRLYAWQILHLRLNAKLVVLWGCETGLGKENRYEGIQGLGRAFQTAGAENVLMTLWGIDQEATSPLLRDFYRRSKENRKGETIAALLREAQIDAIKVDPRPYFWAAFTLQGTGE